jgi:hypothetical protein
MGRSKRNIAASLQGFESVLGSRRGANSIGDMQLHLQRAQEALKTHEHAFREAWDNQSPVMEFMAAAHHLRDAFLDLETLLIKSRGYGFREDDIHIKINDPRDLQNEDSVLYDPQLFDYQIGGIFVHRKRQDNKMTGRRSKFRWDYLGSDFINFQTPGDEDAEGEFHDVLTEEEAPAHLQGSDKELLAWLQSQKTKEEAFNRARKEFLRKLRKRLNSDLLDLMDDNEQAEYLAKKSL